MSGSNDTIARWRVCCNDDCAAMTNRLAARSNAHQLYTHTHTQTFGASTWRCKPNATLAKLAIVTIGNKLAISSDAQYCTCSPIMLIAMQRFVMRASSGLRLACISALQRCSVEASQHRCIGASVQRPVASCRLGVASVDCSLQPSVSSVLLFTCCH